MTKQEQKIEDYLETVCFEANPSVLDDDMPDFFDTWLGNQDVEDMIRHCNNFITTKIAQAITEDRAKVRGMIREKRKELWRFYHEAQLWEEQKTIVKPLDDLLESLDKPLTDKE